MVKCDKCGKYVKDEYHIEPTTYGNKLFCEKCYKKEREKEVNKNENI